MSTLTAASLFAGVGGMDEALRRAGAHVAAAVEIEPACRGVLRRHFPETKILSDVTEVDGGQLRSAGFDPGRGVVASGWPCQGNSQAGRGQGMDDPRSGLWRHNVRLLAEARPRWFLGENVPNLLAVNRGRDFRTVVSDLDELGYGVCWRVLDAQHFGLAQRRSRLIIVGCLGDPAPAVEVLFEPESGVGGSAAGSAQEPGDPPGDHGGAYDGRIVVSTLQGGGKRGYRIDAEGAAGGQLIPAAGGVRRLTPLEWERLQGFPDEWTRWLDDSTEQSDSARYRQMGNAVPVPLIEWVARRLVKADAALGPG